MKEKRKGIFGKAILVVLVLAIMIAQLFIIYDLKVRTCYALDCIDSSIRNLNNAVYNLSDTIDNVQDEESSLFNDVSYSYGELKNDGRTVDVFISVCPKTFEEFSTVTVKIGEQSLKTAKTDAGTFTAVYQVDIFNSKDDIESVLVTITSNDISRSEIVEEFNFEGDTCDAIYINSLVSQFLPVLEYNDETDGTAYTDKIVIKGTVFNNSSLNVKNACLIVETDGEIYKEKPLDLSKKEVSVNTQFEINELEWDAVRVYIMYEDVDFGYTYKLHINPFDNSENTYYDIYDKDGLSLFDS